MGTRGRLGHTGGNGRVSVRAAVVSLLLIGTVAVVGSALAAGGMRAFGSAASAQLGPTDNVASDAWSTFGPAATPGWSALPSTPPSALPPISLAAVPLARSWGPMLSFALQGVSTAADATGPETAWAETPRVGQPSIGLAPWTSPTMRIAPLSWPADRPSVIGQSQSGDDGGTLLAQSPSSGEAAAAPDEAARKVELAKELANPISSLISVPFQQNIQFGIGPASAGWQDFMNVQPVVPFGISQDWNLIARMIMPVVYQDEIFPGAGSQFGIGDTTFEFFFSPKAPTKDGVIWGVGPLFYVPSGAYLLSTSTWGAGVDAVALKQTPKRWLGGGVFTYPNFRIWRQNPPFYNGNRGESSLHRHGLKGGWQAEA